MANRTVTATHLTSYGLLLGLSQIQHSTHIEIQVLGLTLFRRRPSFISSNKSPRTANAKEHAINRLIKIFFLEELQRVRVRSLEEHLGGKGQQQILVEPSESGSANRRHGQLIPRKNNYTKKHHRSQPTFLEKIILRDTSNARALGSPNGSLDHQGLCYCHWLIGGRLTEKRSGGGTQYEVPGEFRVPMLAGTPDSSLFFASIYHHYASRSKKQPMFWRSKMPSLHALLSLLDSLMAWFEVKRKNVSTVRRAFKPSVRACMKPRLRFRDNHLQILQSMPPFHSFLLQLPCWWSKFLPRR